MLFNDKIVVLEGLTSENPDYYVPLITHLPNMKVPLKGVSMGNRRGKEILA